MWQFLQRLFRKPDIHVRLICENPPEPEMLQEMLEVLKELRGYVSHEIVITQTRVKRGK